MAKNKWDSYVRDNKTDRYYEDGVLFLAAPITGTYFKNTGARVADRRSMREDRRINAGDEEALQEERNRFSNNQ